MSEKLMSHLSAETTEKPIDHERLAEIMAAILEGKYSWACVLLLRATGYNPSLYIPYRTYRRLVKENSPGDYKKRYAKIA